MAKIHFPGKTKLTLIDGAGNALTFETIDASLEVHWVHWYTIFILGMGRG